MSQEPKQSRFKKFLKQAFCSHPHVSHTTSMPMLEPLRALFSGKMTPEEYSKLAAAPMVISTTICSRCGAEWER